MSEYKLVYSAYGLLDATSIKLLLESFEIPAEIMQESVGRTYGLTAGKMGSANIYVPEEDLPEARRILDLMESGALELPGSDESTEANNDPDLSEEEDSETD
ncbi:MAG: hypothetical protein BGO78_01465 [Chloroflexi bacterium 44-23]|nr:MAG: hypothetical protein BGO78_01465 [Chloroflexi bacterium 44-23]